MIEGKKVYLDTIETHDLSDLRTFRNDWEIWKWCRQNDLITWQAHTNWYDEISVPTRHRMYAIRTVDTDVAGNPSLIGCCGLTYIDYPHAHAEFSLYIAPRYQQMGYGKEALQLLFLHGFRDLRLHHIFGETFQDNPAIKTFEAVGMKFEGTRRQFYFKNGKFIDAHLYSMLASEFKS